MLKNVFGINFTKNKIFNFTLKIKGIGFCEIQLESGGRGDEADGRRINRSQHDKVGRNRCGDIKTAAYEAMSSEGLEKVD